MEICGDVGAVSREGLLRVLAENDVSIDQEGEKFTFSNGEVIEAQELPSRLPRRLVHRFSRLFGIAIHRFYHPGDRMRVN